MFRTQQNLSTPRITLALVLKSILVFVLVLVVVSYVLFQARNFILGPSITFTSEISPIQTERMVEIRGVAKNITVIWLNGREIYTDEQGVFTEEVVLEDGYTIMTLRAKDRFGRETTVMREFVFRGNGGE